MGDAVEMETLLADTKALVEPIVLATSADWRTGIETFNWSENKALDLLLALHHALRSMTAQETLRTSPFLSLFLPLFQSLTLAKEMPDSIKTQQAGLQITHDNRRMMCTNCHSPFSIS